MDRRIVDYLASLPAVTAPIGADDKSFVLQDGKMKSATTQYVSVALAGDQTINGVKTFAEQIKGEIEHAATAGYALSAGGYAGSPGYVLGMAGFETLAAAVATLGGSNGTVYIASNTSTNTVTIPATMEIIPMGGAVITVNSGQTLTYNGGTQRWPDAQIFAGSGSVVGLKVVLDSWFATAQAGLNAAAGGIYKVAHDRTETAPWVLPKFTTIEGTGKLGAKVIWTHTGDGIQSNWPVNGSTGAYVRVRDLYMQCTNAGNTGGGFVDVAGTFIELHNCFIQGFKYNVIFDQTELAEVDLCDLEHPRLACMWCTNGPQHSPGANGGFTNRITVTRCQFGGVSGTYGVLDDGGNVHAYRDNNFNGFTTHMRMAGVIGLDIRGGEFESATSDIIVFAITAYDGAGSGPCGPVTIGGCAELVPSTSTNPHCINIISMGALSLNGVFLGNTTAAKITGAVNSPYIFAANLVNGGGGPTFDSAATTHYDLSATTPQLPGALLSSRLQQKHVDLPYSSAIAINAADANFYTIGVLDGSPFTIGTPSNPLSGQEITIAIYNASGGTMGAITWGAGSSFRMSAWTNPANGYLRTITFRYVTSNWIETARSAADIAI